MNNDEKSETLERLQAQDNRFEPSMLGEITWGQKWGWTTLALVLSIVIGAAAFYERYDLNKKILKEEHDFTAEMSADLPEQVQQQQADAEKLQKESSTTNEEMQIIAALVILFLLLLGMNILGMLFGYQHSFAHPKSKDSWLKIRAYKRLKQQMESKLAEEQAAWGMVVADANKWFSKYYDLLVSTAVDQGNVDLKKELKKRGPYRMEWYLNERMEERGAGV